MTTATTHNDLYVRDGHLSELTIDRWIAGELEGDELDSVSSHAAQCAVCAERKAAAEAFDADIAARIRPPAHVVAVLANAEAPTESASGANDDSSKVVSLADRRARRNRIIAIATPVVLAAAAAVAVAVGTDFFAAETDRAIVPEVDTIRMKGKSAAPMEVYVNTTAGTRMAEPNEVVHPGDKIGFKVRPSGDGYVMIAGVDDTAKPYLCYPQRGGGEAAKIVARPEGVELPEAMKLDDVLGHERLVAVFCPDPFAFTDLEKPLADAAAKKGDGPLPSLLDGCEQHELTLHKKEPGDGQ